MFDTQVRATTLVRSVISSSMFPVVGEPEPPQRRTLALGEQLPRDDVGMVLHLSDEHLVAGFDR